MKILPQPPLNNKKEFETSNPSKSKKFPQKFFVKNPDGTQSNFQDQRRFTQGATV
jgi:hypothetical protein